MADLNVSPHVIRALLRRHLVLKLRVKGLSYSEIAERVRAWSIENGVAIPKNYNSYYVDKDILREMASVTISEEEKRQERIIMTLTTDELKNVLWDGAVYEQDLKKIDLMIKLLELRAKMWNLDAKPGQYKPRSATPKSSKLK